MNKSKRQRLFKYIAGIYFLSSALSLWSYDPSTQINELKEIVAAGRIPSKSALRNTSQDVKDVLRPLVGTILGTIYVTVSGAGAKDGSSWENAYPATSLKTAIDAAGTAANVANPYLVLIAGGTYTIGESLHMKNNVAIVGGVNKNWDSDKAEKTILDSAGNTRVFRNTNLNSTAVLYGLSITNGSAYNGGGMFNTKSSPTLIKLTFSGNLADRKGAGMYNYKSSSPTLKQVTFSDNTAKYKGGGMHNENSSPSLKQVTFSNNKATSIIDSEGGGGMYNENSSPTLVQVTFSGNSSANTTKMFTEDTPNTMVLLPENKANGGGMYNFNSSPTLMEVTFLNNSAASRGGGMFNNDSSPTLSQATFSNNSAKSGGGMYNKKSSPTLSQATFSDNSAESGGGMLNNESSSLLTGVTFSGNSSSSSGAGMTNYDSSPTLIQVTFVNNQSGYNGGGMNNYDSSSILKQVTFSNNQASNDGGGMNNEGSSPSLMQVAFSNNKAKWGGGMYNSDSSPTLIQATFSNNSAASDEYSGGGGIYSNNDEGIETTIINSIFWGNTQSTTDSKISNQIFIADSDDSDDKDFQIYYSIVEGAAPGIIKSAYSRDPANITSYGLVDTSNIKRASSLTENGSPAIDAGIYVQKSDDNYYYSEDASTWYSTLDGDGLSNKTTPPDTAINLTATDARGYAIVDRPDLGAYEFGGKAP